MLSRVLRVAPVRRAALRQVPAPTLRTFSSDSFSKRESAFEAEFIMKHERDQLRQLLTKLDKQADPQGKLTKTALDLVFEKHKIKLTKELEADLRAWKNDGHFTPHHV